MFVVDLSIFRYVDELSPVLSVNSIFRYVSSFVGELSPKYVGKLSCG